jgi:predicted Zn-dependent protease
VTPAEQSQSLSRPLRETTYSFRTLSQAEANRIKALRLLVVQARQGDTIAALAKNLPYDKYNEAWFRLLNDLMAGEGLKAGERIKVIAG